MKNTITVIAILLVLFSCSSTKNNTSSTNTTTKKESKPILLSNNTFLITEISDDKSYGLSPENPVEVGGFDIQQGPANQRRFLNALAGPNGEAISYYRAGSCCPIKSEKGFMGYAMLDNYRVTWENSKDTVSIYINLYDSGYLKAPVGFTIRGEEPTETEQSAEPSLGDLNVYILLDGKPISKKELPNLDPNNIESLEVIKDKEDIKKYTTNSVDGVIIITSKKNQ